MAARFSYYIDYGAGFVEINPFNNKLKLEWNRGEFNDFIARKKLAGNFSLLETEADSAVAYFITAGNYEAPISIYENGTIITGTLVYEGWAKIKGFYDFTAKIVTFDAFRTNDIYSIVIPLMGIPVPGNQYVVPELAISFDKFTVEGVNANCNELQGYAWSGTEWEISGNALALGTIGRVAVCNVGAWLVICDNYTLDIRAYSYSAPNWSLSASGTSKIVPASTGNMAICTVSTTELAIVDDFFSELTIYEIAAGTWTEGYSKTIERIKYPSIALLTAGYIAMVDEGTQMLRLHGIPFGLYGTPYGLGNVKKPKICSLSAADTRIAMVDAETNMLRAFFYDTGIWTELGESVYIGDVNEPCIMQDDTDVVIVYDSELGYMQTYQFDGADWAEVGGPTAVGGGYSSGMAKTSVVGFVQSDSYSYESKGSHSYSTLLNGINSSALIGIYDSPGYVLNVTGNGATFDVETTAILDLQTVDDIYFPDEYKVSNYEYKLSELLKIPEIFQNYWYLVFEESVLGDYQFKFTQPDLFSSIGTDIVITTYVSSLAIVLNQRTYNDKFEITKENIKFENEANTDFVGVYIEYNRNTPIIEEQAIKLTADMENLIQNTLRLDSKSSFSGLAIVEIDTSSGVVVPAGVGILGGTNVKNEKMSKSRIYDDYWLDYRYFNTGNVDVNGTPSAVQGTCRNIIEFPDVQLPLPAFPTSIASLDWGGGVKSYITNLSMSLDTYITTIKSRLLDL